MSSTRFSPRRRALRPRATAALAVIAVVVAGLFWQASTATALTSVTSNYSYGDFETGSKTPPGWSLNAVAPNRAFVTSPLGISGTHSLYVEDNSTTLGTTARRTVTKVVPGSEYHLQGYAMPKTGIQYLALRFYDSTGRVVLRVATPSTTSTMAWSRIEAHAVAPAGATSVGIEISSSSSAQSAVWWDALEVLRAGVGNSGFETTSSTTPVPSWTLITPARTSAKIATDQARLGSRSLSMTDSSTTADVTATSAQVPVFAGTGHNLRAWLRPTGGSYAVTVRFTDTARVVVGQQRFSFNGTKGVWTLLARQVTAPPTAHWATIELASTAASTGTASWDAVDLRPAPGSGVHTFVNGVALQPVDAFSNTNVADAVVVGGRAKIVSTVSGSPAELQVADLETGTVEQRFPLGTMKTSWTLTKGPDSAVYVGGNDGHLWRWAYGASSVTDVGRATSKSTTVFDLEPGQDGRLWGVSYPGSELWSYNPSTRSITNLGSVSPTHAYARTLAVDGTYAWVGLGSEDPSIMRVTLSNPAQRVALALPSPVTSGLITELDSRGRYLAVKTPSGTTAAGVAVASERRLYDTVAQTWDVPANLAAQRPTEQDTDGNFYYFRYNQLLYVNGATGATGSRGGIATQAGRDRVTLQATIGGVSGEWLLTYDTDGTVGAINLATMQEQSFTVKFLPTKMRIKSVTPGAGTLFVGGYGGSSLAVLDDANLSQKKQYPLIPFGPGVIGEVESTISHGKYQYIGTYTDSRVFRFDTTQPWSDGTNPSLVATLGTSHGQDRPLAWATAGSRTFFGTVPKYGLLGGALGIFDNDTSAPRVVKEPVVDQSVISLAASGDVVYGGTSRWGGLGATPTQPSAKVFAYNASTGKKLWEVAPIAKVEAYGAVALSPNGTLWASHGTTLVELNPANGATLRVITLSPQGAQTTPVLHNAGIVFDSNGLMFLAAASRVYTFDPVTLRVDVAVAGGLTTPMIVVRNGSLYVGQDNTLRQVLVR
ncbi:hypothetical protein [Phycicoccus sp. Root101]|uniref:hypothetical protein n=1 Tax=Phycicoccus sp. Root101 TaxID=1736421 RepID=UPI0007038E91|nr:hypothetical protein [Phycicoccus sp. Root101]KQU69240.1 hypothetical protein ASC58_04870 [Phycicoccus sp. Root101]